MARRRCSPTSLDAVGCGFLWYRLDPDDRDWVTLLHHLIAAGREHDPDFASATADLLAKVVGGSGPSRDAAVESFIRELPSIAAGGAALVFDDFHLVDDAADVRYLARELVAGAPERLSLVFASRRAPAIPLSKLRAVGDVAELGTDQLRFDVAETAQLFTETYGRRIDPDVLADLAVRTEGWVRMAATGPGGTARSIAGRDPPFRADSHRSRPRVV